MKDVQQLVLFAVVQLSETPAHLYERESDLDLAWKDTLVPGTTFMTCEGSITHKRLNRTLFKKAV